MYTNKEGYKFESDNDDIDSLIISLNYLVSFRSANLSP